MMQDMAIGTMEDEQETVARLSNGTISNDIQWPLSQILRSRYCLTSNNSKMVQDRAIFTMADQYGKSYMIYRTAPYTTTLNDPYARFQGLFTPLFDAA